MIPTIPTAPEDSVLPVDATAEARRTFATTNVIARVSSRLIAIPGLAAAILLGGLVAPNVALAVPDEDPEYTGPQIGLVENLEGQHPRLFFDAAGLEEMRAVYGSAAGADLRNALNSSAAGVRGQAFHEEMPGNEGASLSFGLHRLPTVALHYLVSGDQASYDYAVEALQFLLDLPLWSTGGEPNSGKPAGALLAGAAMAYDFLYHDLDPELRDTLRERIWKQARTMYYWGFLMQSPGSSASYWQQDPQNNHRFSRLVGLTLGVLAVYSGDPAEDWMLSKAIEELDFVVRWLPPDGSNHESISYIHYGIRQVLLSAWAGERTLGKQYLDAGYFRNVPLFLAAANTPGLTNRFHYADGGGGGTPLTGHIFYPVAYHDRADVQALIDERLSRTSGHAWINMIDHGPRPEGGSIDNLPRNIRFPDLDIAFFREGWLKTGEVGAMFKAGPFGGYTLNEYRDTNNYSYINVAHDDPDANMFAIWGGGRFSVPNAGYSFSKHSTNHNTILVNNRGQRAEGRSDRGHWSQPATGNTSMRDMAYITNWKDSGSIAIAEGEAANSYPGSGLTRYRRGFLWNEGKYILIFDDIRAQSDVNITWMIQGERVNVADEEAGEFITGTRVQNHFQLKSNTDYTYSIVEAPADHRNSSLGFQQLRAVFPWIQELQIASLHRAWDLSLEMTLEPHDADSATITITGDDFEDVWTWTAGQGSRDPGHFELTSTDGQSFSSEPDLWQAYLPGFSYRSGAWITSDWFGDVFPDYFPWIHHIDHGWMYLFEHGNPASGMLLWHGELGWLWTGQSLYPWVYQYSEEGWIRADA